MTRHAWILGVSAGLLTGLLPGCTLFKGATVAKAPPAKDAPPAVQPRWPVDFPEPTQGTAHETAASPDAGRIPYSASLLSGNPERFLDKTQALPETDALLRSDPPSLLAPRELPEVAPGSAPLPPVILAVDKKPSPPDEPIVMAMRCLLRDHPQEALEYVKRYDPCNQEALICLTAMVAHLTKKKLDNPAEAAALQDQLQKSLLAGLRQRAELMIEKMCFCEWIKDYGIYKPLPDEYAFRPAIDNLPGEQVQVYVEFRNLTSQLRGDGYETVLHCTMRILDTSGKEVFFRDLREQDGSFHTFRPHPDYFKPYSFYVPALAPGKYVLQFEVSDVTRPQAPRLASKTLEFRVSAAGS